MAFEIIIKPVVIDDATDIVTYYTQESDALGERFYNQLLATLIKIQTNPFTFSYVKKPVRRCKLSKFPYKIYYTINGNTIFILGVAHAKRSNAFVRRRLKLLK